MISRGFFVKISVIFLLFLGSAIVFSGTFQAPFVFDDEPNISKNHALQISSLTFVELQNVVTKSPLKSRPVSNLSFAMNYLVHGYDLAGYHVMNILIHFLTSILLYSFVSTTLHLAYGGEKSRYLFISFAAALLWLLHPVQVQSVTYIVQRMNSLSVMFYMLTMTMYVNARLTNNRILSVFLFAGVLISGLLALGSKEIAITLPVFLYIYDVYFIQKKRLNASKQIVVCFLFVLLAVAGVYLFLGTHPLDHVLQGYASRPFTLEQRLLTESRIVFFYLSLLFYPAPSRLNLQHDFSLSTSMFTPWTTILSVAALLGLIVVAFFLFRRHRFVSFSILWFLGNLVLESSIVPLELVFEHRLYLPSMAFCWLAAFFLVKLFSRQWLGFVVVACICLLLASWSWQRNKIWASPLEFAHDCVLKSPGLARVHGSYAEALYKAGELLKAEEEFKQTLYLQQDYPAAHNGLGLVYQALGQREGAIGEYIKALTLNPNYMSAYNNLGGLYFELKEYELAISHLKRAVHLRPDFVQAWYNLALVYEAVGKSGKAESAYILALQFGSVARVNLALGNFYFNRGYCTKAKRQFEMVLKSFPTSIEVQRYLDNCNACVSTDMWKK